MIVTPARVKRGDAGTLDLDLHADLTPYTAARVLVAEAGRPPIISTAAAIAADPTTGIVSFTYTAEQTAVEGEYRLEVEMTPGPHTWPSDTWLPFIIVADLG